MIELIRSSRSRPILAGFLGAVTVLSLFKMFKTYIFSYQYKGSMPFNPQPQFFFWLATSVACGLAWITVILIARKTAQPRAQADAATSGPRGLP